MHLTDEQITKFQGLYRTQFGKTIDRQTAMELGIKLIEMMQFITNGSLGDHDPQRVGNNHHGK